MISLCMDKKVASDVHSAIEGLASISPNVTRHSFWLLTLDLVTELELIMALNPDIVVVDNAFIKENDFDALRATAPEAEIIRIATSNNRPDQIDENCLQRTINAGDFDRGVVFTFKAPADSDLFQHAINYLLSRHIVRLQAKRLSNYHGINNGYN